MEECFSDYRESVIRCAKAYKTNGSNFVMDHLEEMEDFYNKNMSVSEAAKIIAKDTQDLENRYLLFGQQEYDNFEESRKAAITLVQRLNKKDGNKWKSISMLAGGAWIADNADTSEMKSNEIDFFSNQSNKGEDFDLRIHCSDNPGFNWKLSLTPIFFHE